MKFNFASLRLLYRWLSLFLIVVLIYLAFSLLKSEVYRFNPQYLVENSIFNNKEISVAVKKIKSPKLKLKAYLFEEHSTPIISVSLLFRNSGSAYDNNQRHGEATLLTNMLIAGAGKYNMKAFQALLEQKAITLSFDNTNDDIVGNLKFIKKDQAIAVELLNLSLTKPRFEDKYLQQAKTLLISNYKYQMEQTSSLLYVHALKNLYANHPYGRNPYGNPQHLQKISNQHLKKYMQQHFALDNLIIGISGDITETEAQNLLDTAFKGLPKQATLTKIKDINVNFFEPIQHITHSSLQNIGTFWASGPKRQDIDFYPTYVASQILFGSGLGSRIYQIARGDKGLTYGVYGSLNEQDKISYISGNFSATADKFPQLLNIIKSEWQKLGEKGITLTELEQTKDSLIASYPLRFADIKNISDMLVYMQKEQLGLDFLQKRNDYIRKINLEDVNNAARKYFTPDNLRFITIGDSYKEE